MPTKIRISAPINEIELPMNDNDQPKKCLTRKRTKKFYERKSYKNIVPANYHFIRPRKFSTDTKASIETLPTTCTCNDDESIGNISNISDFSNTSNDCVLLSVLDSMELEKGDDSNVCDQRNSLMLSKLRNQEKEYEEYKRFLALLQTNF